MYFDPDDVSKINILKLDHFYTVCYTFRSILSNIISFLSEICAKIGHFLCDIYHIAQI